MLPLPFRTESISERLSQFPKHPTQHALVTEISSGHFMRGSAMALVMPLDRAMTQNNLGTALSSLGERESGTAKLEEAVTAYREALKERTRESREQPALIVRN